ncbi:MAG: OmpH family outer membrane protein [Gallionella sp.]
MKTKIGLLLLGFFIFSGTAVADDFKVGVVNTERVLRESLPAMKAEKKIEKEFAGRNLKIQQTIKQVKDLQFLMDQGAVGLSEVAHRNKKRELNALNVNLQRMQREFREDLSLRKNEELAVVLEKANKAIQAIAETEKYDLILQEAVYRNPSIDITDKVIKRLAEVKNEPIKPKKISK